MGFIRMREMDTCLVDNTNHPFNEILKSLNINNFTLPYPYPENSTQKSVNAFEKIVLIAKVYNGGWVVRPGDVNQNKYIPYKYLNSAGVWVCDCDDWGYFVGFPLGVYFKSSELALKAINTYEDIFDDYFMIKKD